jgi:hypothetical protein
MVRQARVGKGNVENLEDYVRAYCEKENVPCDEGIYSEILGEPTPSRRYPE